MSDPTTVNDLLDTLAKVLLRCWVFGFILLFIPLAVFLLADDWVHSFHAKWYGVSKHEFVLMYYYSMAFMKICVVLFFFIPWVSIKLVLWKREP